MRNFWQNRLLSIQAKSIKQCDMQSTVKLPLLSIVTNVRTAHIINNVVGPVNRLVAMTYVVLG
jgi:hypothetical protein